MTRSEYFALTSNAPMCRVMDTREVDAELAIILIKRITDLMVLIEAKRKGKRKTEFKKYLGNIQYDFNEMQRTCWALMKIINNHEAEDLSDCIPEEFRENGKFSRHL